MPVHYACRHCAATSYKPVIQRDVQGQMRPSGLFKCSGCSVVFADPNAWRQSVAAPEPAHQSPAPLPAPSQAPAAATRIQTGPPNFKTGWMLPPGQR